MPDIIESFRRDHVNMLTLLNLLESQIQMFAQGRSPDYEIIEGILHYCRNYPDLEHHPKEDLVFNMMRERTPEITNEVGDLETLHKNLADLTRRLSAAIRQILLEAEIDRRSVARLARDFISSYRQHIEMEEANFFPAAETLLTCQDWMEIEGNIGQREDPLFGAHVAEEFQELRENVLRWHELGPTTESV
jgi:hemerythrin-like domain-containing protein